MVCKSSSDDPNLFNLNCSDGKETKQVMKQIKRSSSLIPINLYYGALFIISENLLRENVHKWLSPPDPSTNHNIACDTHHKKHATWFFEGTVYQEWKSKGSLLWVHGKRECCLVFYPILSDDVLIL